MSMDAFIAEIMPWPGNFAPRNFAFCNGAILSITEYSPLFSLIGITFGGDGHTNFALPDLRGRAPLGVGQGPGLTQRVWGQHGGQEEVTLTVNELPHHNHMVNANKDEATSASPQNTIWANSGSRTPFYTNQQPNAGMASSAIQPNGGGQAHNNMPPFLTIHYCICLNGLWPSRP